MKLNHEVSFTLIVVLIFSNQPFCRSFAILFVIFALKVFNSDAAPTKVFCESISNLYMIKNRGTQKTCIMNNFTTIKSQGFTIGSARNETVSGMTFWGNRNISFLPDDVHKKFPNLKIFFAQNCSIKAISKDNFKNLTKLIFLSLSDNQIKTIRYDVFNDLTSLDHIELGENILFYFFFLFSIFFCLERNKIHSMSGQSLLHLKKLNVLLMRGNRCININFFNIKSVANVSKSVSQQCNGGTGLTPKLFTLMPILLVMFFPNLQVAPFY